MFWRLGVLYDVLLRDCDTAHFRPAISQHVNGEALEMMLQQAINQVCCTLATSGGVAACQIVCTLICVFVVRQISWDTQLRVGLIMAQSVRARPINAQGGS